MVISNNIFTKTVNVASVFLHGTAQAYTHFHNNLFWENPGRYYLEGVSRLNSIDLINARSFASDNFTANPRLVSIAANNVRLNDRSGAIDVGRDFPLPAPRTAIACAIIMTASSKMRRATGTSMPMSATPWTRCVSWTSTTMAMAMGHLTGLSLSMDQIQLILTVNLPVMRRDLISTVYFDRAVMLGMWEPSSIRKETRSAFLNEATRLSLRSSQVRCFRSQSTQLGRPNSSMVFLRVYLTSSVRDWLQLGQTLSGFDHVAGSLLARWGTGARNEVGLNQHIIRNHRYSGGAPLHS